MADVNHVILIGRLTRNAELKYTTSGQPVCKFAIAVNRRRKKGDEWVDEASFLDIVLWGKSGEAINQYLTKGKQVAVEGALHQDRWEQDGQHRSKIEIEATSVQLLGGGQEGQGGAQQAANVSTHREAQPSASAGHRASAECGGDSFTDDIPF